MYSITKLSQKLSIDRFEQGLSVFFRKKKKITLMGPKNNITRNVKLVRDVRMCPTKIDR